MPLHETAFGRFRLDHEARLLTFDGTPVQLGRRPLEILIALAEARGAIVTKDQLIATVWRGIVVEENNIQVHVSALRKALDACETGQGYLMTVPGQGYRMTGLRAAPHNVIEDADVPAASVGPSITVLPFLNLSRDPADDYFVDGLVEEITSGLSRIRWLQVTSNSSSRRMQSAQPDSARFDALKTVRYLLEGSVQKAAGRVRVNARLIRTVDAVHIWSERYDLSTDHIFDLQDSIMASVIGAMEPSLRQAEIAFVRRKRPERFDAYDCVLRALPFIYGMMSHEASRAMPFLERALELDPHYAAAHAGIAWCHHFRYSRGGLSVADRLKSIHHAHEALIYGADDPTTLAIAALVIWFDEHDEITAFDLFDRALAISPTNAFALFNSAVALAWSGQFDPAVERATRALNHSPYDPIRYLAYNALAIARFCAGKYGEARDAARRGIEANPGFSVPHAYLAAACLRMGRTEEARTAVAKVLERDSGFRIEGFRKTVGVNSEVFDAFASAWSEAGLPR